MNDIRNNLGAAEAFTSATKNATKKNKNETQQNRDDGVHPHTVVRRSKPTEGAVQNRRRAGRQAGKRSVRLQQQGHAAMYKRCRRKREAAGRYGDDQQPRLRTADG